jgi:predicted Ser/Thr protein kinase
MIFLDYELLGEIGAGGSGVVYRARHRTLGRLVALKVLRDLPAVPSSAARFRAEAEAIAGLDHPNIVPLYDAGEHEGRLFYAMKFIDGADLCKCAPTLQGDPQKIARLLAAVAQAVQHAHERGVLHRDLKPGNIVLDNAGEPYLLDFGLARGLEDAAHLTSTGVVVGTPAYMAPEQALGRKDLTPAADVYSLGVILYELLTDRLPFRGETTYQTLQAVLRGGPALPRWLNPDVSRDLEAVCLKCLEKDPRKRYASAAHLATDLRRVQYGVPVQARRAGGVHGFLRRRGRGLAWLCLAAVAIALTLGWLWQRKPELASSPPERPGQEDVIDLGQARSAHFQGNFALFVELMDRYHLKKKKTLRAELHHGVGAEGPNRQRGEHLQQQPRQGPATLSLRLARASGLGKLLPGLRLGLPPSVHWWGRDSALSNKDHRDLTHDDLQRQYERILPCLLYTLEVPKKWLSNPGNEAYCYNWSRSGRWIVTEWGTTRDAATGRELTRPASEPTQAALANHYSKFKGKDDLFCPGEVRRELKRRIDKQLRRMPPGTREDQVARETQELIRVRVSPDRKKVLSGAIGFRYWNVWDVKKINALKAEIHLRELLQADARDVLGTGMKNVK